MTNSPAHPALRYEHEAPLVAPHHATVLSEAVDAAIAAAGAPRRWLDTGCGPGRLVELARERAPEAAFYLADPAEPMLAFARARHPELPDDRFIRAPSHALPELEPFDVITAVLCHHFYPSEAARMAALERCRALLRPGGALVTVEIVRAETDAGQALQRRRWADFQRERGRPEEAIAGLLGGEGASYFPLRTSALGAALGRAGFQTVELFWRAQSLAGFIAIA